MAQTTEKRVSRVSVIIDKRYISIKISKCKTKQHEWIRKKQQIEIILQTMTNADLLEVDSIGFPLCVIVEPHCAFVHTMSKQSSDCMV